MADEEKFTELCELSHELQLLVVGPIFQLIGKAKAEACPLEQEESLDILVHKLVRLSDPALRHVNDVIGLKLKVSCGGFSVDRLFQVHPERNGLVLGPFSDDNHGLRFGGLLEATCIDHGLQ